MIAALKSSNETVSLKAHLILDNTIDVVPNVYSATVDEVHCVHVIKFIVDYCPFLVSHWLQKLKKLNHKAAINRTIPIQICMLLLALMILEIEKFFEIPKKVAKQKIFVNLILDLLGELVKDILVCLRLDGYVEIIVPLVVKILLQVMLMVLFQRIALIEVMEKSKKL